MDVANMFAPQFRSFSLSRQEPKPNPKRCLPDFWFRASASDSYQTRFCSRFSQFQTKSWLQSTWLSNLESEPAGLPFNWFVVAISTEIVQERTQGRYFSLP